MATATDSALPRAYRAAGWFPRGPSFGTAASHSGTPPRHPWQRFKNHTVNSAVRVASNQPRVICPRPTSPPIRSGFAVSDRVHSASSGEPGTVIARRPVQSHDLLVRFANRLELWHASRAPSTKIRKQQRLDAPGSRATRRASCKARLRHDALRTPAVQTGKGTRLCTASGVDAGFRSGSVDARRWASFSLREKCFHSKPEHRNPWVGVCFWELKIRFILYCTPQYPLFYIYLSS